MALKLMYITNNPSVARIAEDAGVDRLFVDMEYIGKRDRQGGMNTVQSYHSVEDVRILRAALKRAQLLVRINPIHDTSEEYCSSYEEIEAVIEAGADILMLPFFKTADEVHFFCKTVAGRAKTMLLVETLEALSALDEILEIPGVDEIHVGLNDLSLACRYNFMFVPLANGTVEKIGRKCKEKNIPFGFGGIASLGKGMLPGEYVIREHYRIGSAGAILSRSFCDTQKITDLNQIHAIFARGVQDIRTLEQECITKMADQAYFEKNKRNVIERVQAICAELEEGK